MPTKKEMLVRLRELGDDAATDRMSKATLEGRIVAMETLQVEAQNGGAPHDTAPEEIEGEAVEEHEHSTDLAVREADELARQAEAVREGIVRYTPEQRQLIKRTLMDEHATDDELALFLAYAQRVGLDPIARQIYAIRRKGRLTIQSSIDAFRLIAKRSRKFAGRLGPWWCGADGQWRDVWLSEAAPLAAKVSVMHADAVEPITAVALWREFYPGDQLGAMWKKMPTVMLAKCAEAQALRAAFPAELSGMYVDEEMEQANAIERGTSTREAGGVVHRQEPQGPPPPRSWTEALERFDKLMGQKIDRKASEYGDADVWLAQVSTGLYDQASIRDLSPGDRQVVFQKFGSVVMDLETYEGELALDPNVRDVIARAFAAKTDGLALVGPPWSLSGSESLPTRAEWFAQGTETDTETSESGETQAADSPEEDTETDTTQAYEELTDEEQAEIDRLWEQSKAD